MKDPNAPKCDYEVRRNEHGWGVWVSSTSSFESSHKIRADAIARGKELARMEGGSMLILNFEGEAQTETELLLELWDSAVCPYCEKSIPAGSRVGTGKKKHGGFCSLKCYAAYYRKEILDRTGLLRPN